MIVPRKRINRDQRVHYLVDQRPACRSVSKAEIKTTRFAELVTCLKCRTFPKVRRERREYRAMVGNSA